MKTGLLFTSFALLLLAAPAFAASRPVDVQAPRGDVVQARRSEGVQAPRGQDTQAPRGDVQAP